MAESNDKNDYVSHILFTGSESFHSIDEGKIWIRLLINLCWWLHDMYEIDGTDPKFDYIDQQITNCQSLFPVKFTLMFSDPTFSPNDQHPLLICRQEEHKIIILVFRATVSSKSLQDVFTDASIYSNHQVYLGDRHSGFSQRVETAPLVAVTNWLRRGWKVIVTGHSLGGAVSQLFTTQVISKLVEAGLTPDMVSLRCVTFGTPQCADHHLWSSYAEWYNVFDTYIYGHDAIFRLATFGAEVTKKVIDSFVVYLQSLGTNICSKVIGYQSEDLANTFARATDPIRASIRDGLIPKYSIFGRHHFIGKNEKCQFKIDSIGESQEERERLLNDLRTGRSWYDYFIGKKLVPDSFNFVCRQFMEHGCYPFSINQLFNRNANQHLDKKSSIKPDLLRINSNNAQLTNNQVSNISGFINVPDEINPSYIYLEGFLVDFITSVKLPIELAESEQLRNKKPTFSHDRSDECAVLCFKSDKSTKYLQTHSWFNVKITTYFGCFDVQVVVLSNFNSTGPSIYQLDPILIVLRAYYEFVLDASSIEQIDSSLSHCFSLFFTALKHIGEDKVDTIMARYFAEAQTRNLLVEGVKDTQNWCIPGTEKELKTFFDERITKLKEINEDEKNDSEIRRNALFLYQALEQEVQEHLSSSPLDTTNQTVAEDVRMIPLNLNFVQLRQNIQNLHISHTHYEIDQIRKAITTVLAPSFFIRIKLKRLHSFERDTGIASISAIAMTGIVLGSGLVVALGTPGVSAMVPIVSKILTPELAMAASSHIVLPMLKMLPGIVQNFFFGDYQIVIRSLCDIAISLLISAGENINEYTNEWQVLNQIAGCHWSRKLTHAKSPENLNTLWTETFTKEPLKNVTCIHRWNFVGVLEICHQLCAMRQILAGQPPKVVITGQSQTGKSTLFSYLTRRNLEELDNNSNFNTRMSIQCQAFIQLDDKSNVEATHESVLPINVIDSPGYDDAAGISDTLLDMSLDIANLVILVTTLKDINQTPTIRLLEKILNNTQVKILVLINQVDLRLKKAWKKFKAGSSNKYKNSDDDNSDNDESDGKFSLCKTLNELIERPQKELIQGLNLDSSIIENRITFQPIILKGFNEFIKPFKEPDFRKKVHKSNVDQWIKRNLINTNRSKHS
jgi:small GTP-binding protein